MECERVDGLGKWEVEVVAKGQLDSESASHNR